MNFLRTVCSFSFGLALWACGIAHAQGSALPEQVRTPHVRATLLAHAPDGVAVGQTIWLGLELVHQPHWHTYWKNPGDSGLPTTLRWSLPEGVQAGDVAWPLPQKINVGNLVNYGYEGTVLLPVPLTITAAFKPGLFNAPLAIGLKASWLVCRLECIPEDVELGLKLPLQSALALHGAQFEKTWAALPKPLAASGTMRVDGARLVLSLAGLPQALWGKTLMALPEVPEVIEPSAPWQQAWQDNVWTASFPLMRTLQAAPQTLPLVLHESAANPVQGHVVTLQLQGAARVTHSPAVLNPAPPSAAEATSQAHLPLWAAVLGALLGGLILNLMPCVLPVLAIKLLSFTQPGLASATHRRLTWAYGVGVVLSFVSLGALMLLLRGLGLQLGWGFQLQLPLVVAALAALFTLLGLNLSGVFEFGQLLPSRWASVEARHPSRNAFLSGVLAVVVASPCTAPFMGAALGLAWSLPAPQTLLIFATMGLGMALPFVLVSHVPALARRLPKPGAWMLTFRRVMAFPMYATVVWLVWVLGQQSGADAAAALLALLVALSAVVWACTLSARLRLWFLGLSLAVLGFLIWAIGPQVWQTDTQRAWAVPRAEARWQAWTPDKVTQLLASGRPVFVDFTAAWCVTCQYNKRTTLADARVLADMDLKNVATLRADWTLRNPTITQTLNQLGRNGVPTYALYVPGQAPLLLSELLSVAEVRAALARL